MSVLCAIVVVVIYTILLKQAKSQDLHTERVDHRLVINNLYSIPQVPVLKTELKSNSLLPIRFTRDLHGPQRRLLVKEDTNYDESVYFTTPVTPPVGDDDDDGDNCTAPRGVHPGYNDSCLFVLDQCQDEVTLINYLSFALCTLANVEVCPSVCLL